MAANGIVAGTFIALLGGISYIASRFLPMPPGMDAVPFIGAAA